MALTGKRTRIRCTVYEIENRAKGKRQKIYRQLICSLVGVRERKGEKVSIGA